MPWPLACTSWRLFTVPWGGFEKDLNCTFQCVYCCCYWMENLQVWCVLIYTGHWGGAGENNGGETETAATALAEDGAGAATWKGNLITLRFMFLSGENRTCYFVGRSLYNSDWCLHCVYVCVCVRVCVCVCVCVCVYVCVCVWTCTLEYAWMCKCYSYAVKCVCVCVCVCGVCVCVCVCVHACASACACMHAWVRVCV